MKRIELENIRHWLIGMGAAESTIYIIQEKDYSLVEFIHISNSSNFNLNIEVTKLNLPNLKMIALVGPETVDCIIRIFEKLVSFHSISNLYFDTTGIVKPPDFVFKCNQLNYLEFRHEEMMEISDQVFELVNLQRLTFAYCVNITSIPNKIKCLQNLEEFNLWQASIKYISPELFLLPMIKSIKFSYSTYSPTMEVKNALEIFNQNDKSIFYSWE